MPTTYAHYRFGRDVLARLPEEARACVARHEDLFHFGLHGPDLLFYYRPLPRNRVNALGYASHGRTGRDFFTEAVAHAQKSPDPDAAKSYLYGVLCHFTLDRCCHPYVAEKEQTGVSHHAIESSFDRFLMERDGLDPVTHPAYGHLHPNRADAAVIAEFYPPLTGDTMYESQQWMVRCLRALVASGTKRTALSGALSISGKARLQDLLIPLQPRPECRDSDLRLLHHYKEALALWDQLFSDLQGLLAGDGQLGPGYDHTFGAT